MVDFIDEVNEELRRERLARSWHKMGRYVVGLSLAVVLATVAMVIWKEKRKTYQETAAIHYFAAEKLRVAKKSGEAEAAFAAIAREKAEGFSSLAQLKRASALREDGKNEEAVKVYLELAADSKADSGLRSFARIYAAQLMTEAKKNYAEIETVLKPVTGEKDSSFASLAREQLAFAALANGDAATAKKLLEEIAADTKAGPSLKQRAAAQAASLSAS